MSFEGTPHCKIFVIGDGAIGKTCMLITLAGHPFPIEYIPTVFDDFPMPVDFGGQKYVLDIFDSASRADYDILRPKYYPGTHLFIVCFSVVSFSSFNNITQKWMPELEKHAPDVPFILVGLKTDLRDEAESIEKLRQRGESPISKSQAQALAKEIGACEYVEYSALVPTGKDALLRIIKESSIKASLGKLKNQRQIPNRQKGARCLLM